MKINIQNASNFRLQNNSIDGRVLSAQGVREKLGLRDTKFSISKIGENNISNDTDDIVELSQRAKSNLLYTGDEKSITPERSGVNSLMAFVDDDLAAKGWKLEDYYRLLFQMDAQEVNEKFGTSFTQHGFGISATTEQTVARFNELREQVMKEFSHDANLLDKHLTALEKGFEARLVRNAQFAAFRLETERMIQSVLSDNEYTDDEFHPLAMHKDFNFRNFAENARELMMQFAQEYTQQLKVSLGDYSAAWESTLKLMSERETTSVNNLSLNDFMILEETRPFMLFDTEGMTKRQAMDAFGNLHEGFLSHEKMSEYLRNALAY